MMMNIRYATLHLDVKLWSHVKFYNEPSCDDHSMNSKNLWIGLKIVAETYKHKQWGHK